LEPEAFLDAMTVSFDGNEKPLQTAIEDMLN